MSADTAACLKPGQGRLAKAVPAHNQHLSCSAHGDIMRLVSQRQLHLTAVYEAMGGATSMQMRKAQFDVRRPTPTYLQLLGCCYYFYNAMVAPFSMQVLQLSLTGMRSLRSLASW
jgi:hypothetical protein